MQLEVILTGNRIAASCKAEKTTESMNVSVTLLSKVLSLE